MKVLNYLEEMRQIDVVSMMEVEFIRFLQTIAPDESEEVYLAAAVCMHAQREGHICMDLGNVEEEYLFGNKESEILMNAEMKGKWIRELAQSSLVSKGNELKPLVLEEERLYLHRFYRYEEELAAWLKNRSKISHPLTERQQEIIRNLLTTSQDLFDVNWQNVAVLMSFIKDLVVISGGPGTGKTYTVLNIITAHVLDRKDEPFRVALAAPTGKAARRLADSITNGKKTLPDEFREVADLPETATTVHKLLGAGYRSNRLKYHEDHKLPYDLIVIDEASMLDITLWVQLIKALDKDTKLIVLGDKDQLASVEAGSILGDICGGDNSFSAQVCEDIAAATGMQLPKTLHTTELNDCVVFLTKSYRFSEDSGIQHFAKAINEGDADTALGLLKDSKYQDLNWLKPDARNIQDVIDGYAVQHFDTYIQQKEKERLPATNRRKILCAIRKGPLGVEQVNAQAERMIKSKNRILAGTEWYEGRLVMATRNDPVLKIRNGEIGICNGQEDPRIKFDHDEDIAFSVARVKDYEPAFAITIHKSQGSEFDEVAIFLTNQVNSILSKEILYTSVTRARLNTLIIASEEILRAAIRKSVSRNSGLRQKLWEI